MTHYNYTNLEFTWREFPCICDCYYQYTPARIGDDQDPGEPASCDFEVDVIYFVLFGNDLIAIPKELQNFYAEEIDEAIMEACDYLNQEGG